jgi:putative tryptophan/tyrosine transport system substrate-binding protein
MRRREFITLLGSVTAACSLSARAQEGEHLRRIGAWFTNAEDEAEVKRQVARFQDELARLGWVQGKTIRIEYRFGTGNIDQYPQVAKELIGLRPELIVTQSTPITAALSRETRAIPIVFTRVSDPVGSGFVSSLAKPGGNLTALLQYEASITGKWLAMLKEIAPQLAHVAYLASSQALSEYSYNYFLQSAKSAASPLGIEVVPSPINNNGAEIEFTIAAFARASDSGLLVAPSPVNIAHRDLIIDLAARYRLPAVYPWRYFVTAGGLMSYGIDDVDVLRDAASYVDRILHGANPAEMPVQAPTKYETVVNLKTARTLGLEISASLLVRADEVIE